MASLKNNSEFIFFEILLEHQQLRKIILDNIMCIYTSPPQTPPARVEGHGRVSFEMIIYIQNKETFEIIIEVVKLFCTALRK